MKLNNVAGFIYALKYLELEDNNEINNKILDNINGKYNDGKTVRECVENLSLYYECQDCTNINEVISLISTYKDNVKSAGVKRQENFIETVGAFISTTIQKQNPIYIETNKYKTNKTLNIKKSNISFIHLLLHLQNNQLINDSEFTELEEKDNILYLLSEISIYIQSYCEKFDGFKDIIEYIEELKEKDVYTLISDVFTIREDNKNKIYELKKEYMNFLDIKKLDYTTYISLLTEELRNNDFNNKEIIEYIDVLQKNKSYTFISTPTAMSERKYYSRIFDEIEKILDKSIHNNNAKIKGFAKLTLTNNKKSEILIHKIIFMKNKYYIACTTLTILSKDKKNINKLTKKDSSKESTKELSKIDNNLSIIPISDIKDIEILENSKVKHQEHIFIDIDIFTKDINSFIENYLVSNRNITEAFSQYEQNIKFNIFVLVEKNNRGKSAKYFDKNPQLKGQVSINYNDLPDVVYAITEDTFNKKYKAYKYSLLELKAIEDLFSKWFPHIMIYCIKKEVIDESKVSKLTEENDDYKIKFIKDQSSRFIYWIFNQQRILKDESIITNGFANTFFQNLRKYKPKLKKRFEDKIIEHLRKDGRLEEFSKKIEEELKKEELEKRHSKEL